MTTDEARAVIAAVATAQFTSRKGGATAEDFLVQLAVFLPEVDWENAFPGSDLYDDTERESWQRGIRAGRHLGPKVQAIREELAMAAASQ